MQVYDKPDDCPLRGNCMTNNIVYRATVSSTQGDKTYIGISGTDFKKRLYNHKASFTNNSKKNATALSKHIWNLKDSNTVYDIKWEVVKQCKSYSNITKRCNLCLWEKYFILKADKSTSLNSRSEFISTCRHKRKFYLSQQD